MLHASVTWLRRRPSLLAAFGYLAVVVVIFHRLLLGEVLSPAANLWAEVPFRSELPEDYTAYLNGVQGDVWREFESWHDYQYRAAREARFPLWSPHIFCGFPVHANGQSAMLSPFHWVYFVVDPKWSAGLVAALKLWVAGFATFCLGRRLGMTAHAGFLAGTAWMLSAFMVRWLQWNHSAAAALMPVVLTSLDALVVQATWRRVALAGLAATGLQLSGHPETQFHVGVLAGVYVLARVSLSGLGVRATIGRVLLAGAAQVVGLLGAAVSLAPFAEQMLESADWRESTHALSRSLPVDGLIGAIAPDHFGRPRAGRFYQGPLNYNEAGLYIGIVPLALAATVLLRLLIAPRQTFFGPAGPVAVIFATWFVLCGVVVLGVPGVLSVLQHLPLFSKADNLRLLLGVQFAGAMLAGAAVTQLMHDARRWGVLLVGATWATVVSLAIAMCVRRVGDLYNHIEGLLRVWADSTVPAPLEHRSLRTAVSLGVALVAAVWSLSWWSRPQRGVAVTNEAHHMRRRHVCALLGLAITLIDMTWVAYGFNSVVPARVIFPPAPAMLRRLTDGQRDGRLIATDEILAPNLAMRYDFRDLRGYDFPLDPRWTELFRRLNWKPGITLMPRRQVVPCVDAMVQSVADKSAVRFLYTSSEQDGESVPRQLAVCGRPELAPWQLVVRGAGRSADIVYQNRTAYPRCYLAQRATFAPPGAALDAVLDVTRDLRQQSFVEDPDRQLAPDDDRTPGTATIEVDKPERIVVRTRSTARRLLVLSDRYDPNWRAEIDGSPAPSIRANYLFRGVVVPEGEHVVEWSYRPTLFYWGLGVSSVVLASLVVMTLANPSRARTA
jgi:hypothetical protein